MLVGLGSDHSGQARPNPIWRAAMAADVAGRTRWLLALLERTIAHDAGFSSAEGYVFSAFFNYGTGAHTMASVFDGGVDAPRVVPAILDWYSSYRFVYYGAPILEKAVRWITAHYTRESLPPHLRERLVAVRAQYDDVG